MIRQEIVNLLEDTMGSVRNKERNINAIIDYFGLYDGGLPTLEELSDKYSISNAVNNRERARQIIKNNFYDNVSLSDVPSLTKISDVLEKSELMTSDEILDSLIEENLVPSNANLFGVINLLQDFGLCKDLNLYTYKFNKATRNNILTEQPLFLVRNKSLATLKKSFGKLLDFSGRVGVASFELFFEANPKFEEQRDVLYYLIQNIDSIWVLEKEDGSIYYTAEEQCNTMINNLEKIKNVTETVSPSVLGEVLSNAFRSRTPPKNNAFPDPDLVELYMQDSRFTTFKRGNIQIKTDIGKLTDIESDIHSFMKGKGFVESGSIREHLLEQGYSLPYIQKSIYSSPLIYVDKEFAGKSKRYALVSHAARARS